MIFKHCSPECTVASGSARRLACSATTSRCLSPLLPSVPSSRSMTSLLTSLYDSQPASGPDCCLELIWLYELCFLFFFFFLFTASLTNGNVPPGSQAPRVDRRAYRTPLHCLSHLLSLGGGLRSRIDIIGGFYFGKPLLCFGFKSCVFFQKWPMECIRGNRETSLRSWFAPLHVPISAQVPRDAAFSAFALKSM